MRDRGATPPPRPATRGRCRGRCKRGCAKWLRSWLRKVAAIVAARSRRRPLQRCLPGGARVSRAVSGDPPETIRSACANTADFQICASSDLCIGERVVERALRTRFGGRESPPPRRETHPSCRKRARRSRSTTLPSRASAWTRFKNHAPIKAVRTFSVEPHASLD
jgi:hypothetical protein